LKPALTEPETLVLKTSRGSKLGLLLVSVVFVVLGLLMVTTGGGDVTWGWLSILFFGLCTLVFAYQLLHRETLTLTREGFAFTNLGRTHHFNWSEVDDFGVARMRARWQTLKRVGFCTEHDSGIARALWGGYDAALPDSYGLSPDHLAALMETWRQAASQRP
jgi:hypothetical protein